MTAAGGNGYPPAPWTLRGQALLALRWLPLREAQRLVPDDVRLVPLAPRRTLCVVLCAHYASGSTLTYDELIFAPGLVRSGGRFGAWISGIWVDDPASLAAGREIWGLPKQRATFHWSPGRDRVRVSSDEDGRSLCELGASAVKREAVGLPLPVAASVWGRRGEQLVRFGVRGWIHARPSRGNLSLHERGIDLVEARAWVLALGRLRLRIGAPR